MSETPRNLWLFGSDTLVILAIMQIIGLALTLLHSLQERKGRLWRYFGAIAGFKIADPFGRLAFFWVLTLSLWAVGLLGITGTVLWRYWPAFGCLGALVGCRMADGLFSHILLDRSGYRPNPGLASVPLYLAEAVILLIVFSPTVLMHPISVLIGFAIGAGFFYAVVPALSFFGPFLFQPIPPWQKNGPQPTW